VSWRPRWRRPPRRGKGVPRRRCQHTSPTQGNKHSVRASQLADALTGPLTVGPSRKPSRPRRGNRAGALPGQARISTTPVRSRPLSTHSDSPEGRLPQKVATISVSHGHAFPSEFSVTASKQQTRNHGAYHPKGFHPQKRCITDHQALSNDHLYCSIEAIITEVTTTGRLLR